MKEKNYAVIRAENALWSAMDELLDTLLAIVLIPVEEGQSHVRLTVKDRERVRTLHRRYRRALRQRASLAHPHGAP